MPRKVQQRKATSKPTKPRPDFPLFPHASGRWAKKVKGKFAYFGRVADDPRGERALAQWLEQKDHLLAGLTPPAAGVKAGVSVKDLCDAFLTAKEKRIESGELTRRTFGDYLKTAQGLAAAVGKLRLAAELTPADFAALRAKWGRQWGPTALGNELGRVRSVFKWGYDSGLLDHPMRFGPDFARPTAKTMRLARAAKGKRLFTAAELRAILDAAEPQLRAMAFLGINCGLGNSDCARLERRHLDLDAGWLDFPRPKTGVERRCPLWRETIDAIHAALAVRPKHRDPAHADLIFITKYGDHWRTDTPSNPISPQFKKLLVRLGIARPGLGLYTLRHVLETIGGGVKDPVAVSAIQGHAAQSSDMSSRYREGVEDERLQAVVDHVHAWLFDTAKPKPR